MNANTKANLLFVLLAGILLIPILLILNIAYFSLLINSPNATFGYTDVVLIIAFALLIEYIIWLIYKKFLKQKVIESFR